MYFYNDCITFGINKHHNHMCHIAALKTGIFVMSFSDTEYLDGKRKQMRKLRSRRKKTSEGRKIMRERIH